MQNTITELCGYLNEAGFIEIPKDQSVFEGGKSARKLAPKSTGSSGDNPSMFISTTEHGLSLAGLWLQAK
jgi:hypothetical protein